MLDLKFGACAPLLVGGLPDVRTAYTSDWQALKGDYR